MGQVIAVVSGKGGTGKTSFTALVGSALAEMGHRTLCLDAGLGDAFRLATCAADRAVVVATTAPASLRDAQRTVMELRDYPNGRLHLVVNRVRRKLLKALSSNIDDAIDAAGLPLLGVIPEDPDVPYCLNRGLVLREQNYYAARAYENIAKRIMGQKAPLMKI